MKPPLFDYVRATSVSQALDALVDNGDDARLLAGGQSIVSMLNFRMITPSVLIDIANISELRGISLANGKIRIGAMSRHSDVMRDTAVLNHLPLVTEAYAHVAHHAIRNRGTIGGNVCHHDLASELPLVLTLLDAEFVVVGRAGERRIPAADFFVDAYETAVDDKELLAAIEVPKQGPDERFAFEEFAIRVGDYPIAGAGVRFRTNGSTLSDVRIGFIGTGIIRKRNSAAESLLTGASPTREILDRVVEVARATVEPSSDLHATAEDKIDLIGVLLRRALERALGTQL
jgi:carbon-monoxide dehydrogenase medium subunit